MLASLLCTCGLAFPQDAIETPAHKTIGMAKTEIVPSLIVINSDVQASWKYPETS